MAPLMDVNIASREFKADPYSFFTRLRVEAPVCRVPLTGRHHAWLVTRYDDVAMVLKDKRFGKDRMQALTPEQRGRQPWIPSALKPLMSNMLDQDPPNHTRLRALVHKAFTPQRVEALRERVQTLSDALLDRAMARGHVDLIRDYALPIPSTIIAELLGVPVRDQHRFQKWSQAIIANTPTAWGMVRTMPAVLGFMRYIRTLIGERRRAPQDDLLSALVQAEEAGDTLSEDEMVAMIILLLIAGHETTVNLIGSGTLALLEHPEQAARLQAEPELLRSAVEELLRFTSPVMTGTERYTREPVTVAGETIPAGELVYAVIASANRDAAQFPEPDTLDLAREPNRHLSLGQGIHYCLGAPLARLEGQIAIGTLLHRCPTLRLAGSVGDLRWRPGFVLRGLEALPVTLA